MTPTEPAAITVSTFLFNPQELTVAFLVLMSVVSAVGLLGGLVGAVMYHLRLRRGALDYEANKEGCAAKFEPESYLRVVGQPQSLMRWLDAPAPILLTLGILGTFLGLGMAVSEATASLVNPENAMPALQALLKVVSFKFQTSAWGVILSLAFTVAFRLPLEFYVETWTAKTAAGLLRHRKGEDDVLATAVREAIQLAFGQVASTLNKSSSDLATAAGKVASATTTMQQQVGALSTTVETSSRTLTTATTGLTGAAADLGGLGKTINTQLESVSAQMTKNLDASSKHFREVADKQASEMKTQLESVTSGIQKSLTSMSTELKASLDKQQGVATQAQGQIANALTGLNGGVAALQKDIGGAMKSLNQHQAATTAAVADLGLVLKSFDEKLGQLTKVLEAQSAEAGKLRMQRARQEGAAAAPAAGGATARTAGAPPAVSRNTDDKPFG